MEDNDLDAKLIEVAKKLVEYLYLVKKMDKQAALQYVEHLFEIRDSFNAHEALQANATRSDNKDEQDEGIETDFNNQIQRINKRQLDKPKNHADLLVMEQRMRQYFDGKILRLFHNMFMAQSVLDVNIQLSMLQSCIEKQEQAFTAIKNVKQAGLWPQLSHV